MKAPWSRRHLQDRAMPSGTESQDRHVTWSQSAICHRSDRKFRLKCDGTRAETRFRLSAKRTSPFKSAEASVQSTTGSRGVRISGSNAGYTMFRGSVKSTGYPLHSPVSPSVRHGGHHISTGLYLDCTRALNREGVGLKRSTYYGLRFCLVLSGLRCWPQGRYCRRFRRNQAPSPNIPVYTWSFSPPEDGITTSHRNIWNHQETMQRQSPENSNPHSTSCPQNPNLVVAQSSSEVPEGLMCIQGVPGGMCNTSGECSLC